MRNLFNFFYLDKLGKVLVNLLANWNGPEDATVVSNAHGVKPRSYP